MPRLRGHVRRMGLAYLIFLISLVPEVVLCGRARYNLRMRDQQRLEKLVADANEHVDRRFTEVNRVLRDVRALFVASQKVHSREWNLFLDSLGFSEGSSGFRDLGFALRISSGEFASRLAELSEESKGNYQIDPPGERAEYFPIIFLRDKDMGDFRAFGWDPYSDGPRRAAMEKARDTGTLQATERVQMVVPASPKRIEGRILYLPVYRGELQPTTLAERREKLVGFIFASCREDRLWEAALPKSASELADIDVFDEQGRLAFDTFPALAPNGGGRRNGMTLNLPLDYFGKKWQVRFRTLPAFDQLSQQYLFWYAVSCCAIISLTLLTLARRQANRRIVAERMMADLEKSRKALVQSEARFRRMADNARDVIYRLRLKPTVGYEYISKAIERIAGYPPARFYEGAGFLLEFVHPDDRHLLNFSQSIDRWFGGPMVIRWITKSGSVLWTETRNVPVYDDDGNIVAMEGIARDITESKFTEETIRRSEERLSRVLETIADGVLILDGEGKISFANEAAEQIFNLHGERKEAGCRGVSELVDLLRRGESQSFGYSFRANDGGLIYLSVNSARFSTRGGAAAGIVASIRDVTAEKHNEESLLQSQTRLRILNNILGLMAAGAEVTQIVVRTVGELSRHFPSVQILYSLPTENGKWLVVCAEGGQANLKGCGFDFRERLGVEKDLAGGCAVVIADLAREARFAPAPNDEYFEGVRATIEQPIRKGSKLAGLLSFHSQTPREWTSSETVILREIADYISAAHTQSEIAESRRHAEAALESEKKRLAVTLRSIGDGVITTDIDGKVVLLNRAAELLTGWPQTEAIGREIDEVFCVLDEKSREKIPNLATQALEKGHVFLATHGFVLQRRDESERAVAGSAAAIRDQDGRIVGAVLVCHDVTEKRRFETELLKASKLESVGLLAGGIAHDFNNILSVILGNVTLCKMLAPPIGSLNERLGQAEKGCLRARELTQQLLTFAKGGSPIRKAASVAEIVHEATAFAARGSNVVCKNSAAAELWPVEVDEGQMSQVFNNLVINAVQAMPNGGTLQTRMENWALTDAHGLPLAPGRYVHIAVQDSGVGIQRENLARIFDPYYSTKQGGSGLGLATTYAIIQKHQGCITVESIEGVGTTFHIYLPASEAPLPPKQQEPESIPRGGGRILVMDDETSILDLARASLRHFGYDVDTAEHGAEAVQKYETARANGQPFSAVIMDLTVPGGMGGKEAMKRLLEIDPKVRAIVSSGYSQDPVMANYREYGFAGVVEKPYQIEFLAKTLSTILRN